MAWLMVALGVVLLGCSACIVCYIKGYDAGEHYTQAKHWNDGYRKADLEWKYKAAEHGFGEWILDTRTGQSSFRLKEGAMQ